MIQSYSAAEARGKLELFSFDPGELAPDGVEIDVGYCGVCHSDVSMINNDFGITQYPFVPGHEVAGTVAAKGEQVTHLEIGQKVGLGWYSRSCLTCNQCMTGNHNLCLQNEQTIVGRHGGLANKVRCAGAWATPLGSPATTAMMLDFCSRHDIAPVTEGFGMSQVNEALEHLEAGKARYRVVLKNDIAS